MNVLRQATIRWSATRPVAIAFGCLLPVGLAVPFVLPEALRAWLAGWLFVLGIPAGATALLLIHGLTGGRWGDAFAPMLRRAAATMPFHTLLFVPVILGAGTLYPWAGDPGVASAVDVTSLYLNPPGFIARSLTVLAAWNVFALYVAGRNPDALTAALGLIVYGIGITVGAVDWVMALSPRWDSTAIGWALAATNILTALAWLALRTENLSAAHTEDLAKMLIAMLLAVVYLWFIQYLIIWSGNMPHKAIWFVTRQAAPWSWTMDAAVLLGALAPFCLLLRQSARRSRPMVGAAGGLLLGGTGLLTAWQVLPNGGQPPLLLVAYTVLLGAFLIPMLAMGRSQAVAPGEARR